MADICDSSDNEISAIYQLALKKANSTPSLISTGFCHYCMEPVSSGRLFCPSEENGCAEDWQHEQDAKRRNGY